MNDTIDVWIVRVKYQKYKKELSVHMRLCLRKSKIEKYASSKYKNNNTNSSTLMYFLKLKKIKL